MRGVPQQNASDFYPRPPGGGRLQNGSGMVAQIIFLSTPSGWRATLPPLADDCKRRAFLSTPSGWRATSDKYSDHIAEQFLSTPFGWRATDLEFPMEDE